MRAPEADSAGQADHSTLVRMNGLHGQEFHFFTCFAPLLVHLNIIPLPAKNLRQAASTDSRVLVEIGLSGISSLCVFWRIRIASVELIDSRHREGPIVLAFITAIGCRALTALQASALMGHLLREASAQISGIKSSNGDELKGSQIFVAIGRVQKG